ncbi:hypothetical protein [Rhizobium leguminosarum]|uniref:Uncharacterized protein n=1 Tax=Rhizobium leguminosarum TaxID=384 RepID=A0A7K3VJS0_RHILE|nr:hypothetical protein [Rhizobium leguminosarum]NEK17450.1 hypothetical protein [Rhizobium leguminosarum]
MTLLEHLREACDAIISGQAPDEAKAKKQDSRQFRSRIVTPENIYQYCKKVKSYDGPHFATIRANPELLEYVELRNKSSRVPRTPAKQTEHQVEVNDALNRITSIDDRQTLWEEVEEGRAAKAHANMLLQFLSGLPSVIVDALPGKKMTIDNLRVAPTALDPTSKKLLRELVRSLTDNEVHLAAFDLIYKKGRVRMDYGAETELISPEQMQLLLQLAGIREDGTGAA